MNISNKILRILFENRLQTNEAKRIKINTTSIKNKELKPYINTFTIQANKAKYHLFFADGKDFCEIGLRPIDDSLDNPERHFRIRLNRNSLEFIGEIKYQEYEDYGDEVVKVYKKYDPDTVITDFLKGNRYRPYVGHPDFDD
jgi:hypothetical protein